MEYALWNTIALWVIAAFFLSVWHMAETEFSAEEEAQHPPTHPEG